MTDAADALWKAECELRAAQTKVIHARHAVKAEGPKIRLSDGSLRMDYSDPEGGIPGRSE